MLKLSYFKYPFLYSILFLIIIGHGSTSNYFVNYSDISRVELYPIWIEYFAGLFTTFTIIGLLSSNFSGILNQVIFFIVFLRNTFFKKIIYSFKSKLHKNFLFSDLIILIILGIGLFMGLESIIHYFDRYDVVGQRTFDRYYITKTRQNLFILTSIISYLQIIRKTRFSRLSYFILILGSLTQAFVDHSRFSVLPFFLITMGFLFSKDDLGNIKRNILRSTDFLKIKKINILKIVILILLGLLLLNTFNLRFRSYTVFFYYFTSASFYGLGEKISSDVFTYKELFFALTGIPLQILRSLGIEYDMVRISVSRPLTGLLQLYVLENSYYFSGVFTALILSLPLTLIRYINSFQIRNFSFILLLATTVTLPQYDLRASLRLLQFVIIISIFSLDFNKKYINSKY